MAGVITGLCGLLLMVLIFVNIADYALYSIKRSNIAKGIDNAVCAVIQEIDVTASESGLSNGFDETTGKILVNHIVLNETAADNAFYSTLLANTGIKKESIFSNTLVVTTVPLTNSLNYVIRKESQRQEGSVTDPANLEALINNSIKTYWSISGSNPDPHTINVGGNPKTNKFSKAPCYMVFIKNYEIDGLFRKRTATFVGFAGAKISRKDANR